MIIPQPEDVSFQDLLTQEYRYKAADLFQKPSPVLPLHYDKSYLPKNLCERQYLDMFECIVFRSTDRASSCSYNISRFETCRKIRDLKILSSIKQWETKHLQNMQKQNKQFYLQGLTFKLDRLKDDYSKTPSTQARQYKLSQIQSQINQIKWRMKYIKNIIKQGNIQSK